MRQTFPSLALFACLVLSGCALEGYAADGADIEATSFALEALALTATPIPADLAAEVEAARAALPDGKFATIRAFRHEGRGTAAAAADGVLRHDRIPNAYVSNRRNSVPRGELVSALTDFELEGSLSTMNAFGGSTRPTTASFLVTRDAAPSATSWDTTYILYYARTKTVLAVTLSRFET